jgi:hypothetical protein
MPLRPATAIQASRLLAALVPLMNDESGRGARNSWERLRLPPKNILVYCFFGASTITI